MVLKAYKSLLGEDWFQSFAAFRLNPETFLDRRKLTRDAFCLDVLKELYLDFIEIQNKIHLLLLLQEYSSLLIKDINLLEQVVGSLTNLCDILGTKPDKRLLKSQTLVTIVTILLSQNLDHDFSRLVAKVKALLLDVIYNVSEDSTVISTACQCLEELEVFFPDSLESEIRHLLETSERETSPSFQSYILLLSICVKHLTAKLHQESNVLHKVDETKKRDAIQISSFVSHVLELLPYMTHAAVYRVLKDLIFVVRHTPDLTPTTFKLHLQNLMMSSDLPLFHLAFDLMEAFGSELISAQEEKYLLMQVMKMSTHPCLTASHRLLFLDWLKSCTLNTENAYFSSLSHYSNLHLILPTPFDGPLTQEKKSYVLSLSIPSNSDKSLAGDFLNECINGLTKCSLLAGGTKAAPSLFRTLFVFYCSHQSEVMHNSMYKLLIGILKTSPHLTPYALSFLYSVKSKSIDSQFHERILGHLVEHILSIPMKQFLSNLEYYFCILGSASEEQASVCRPRAVLRLFQKLLNNEGFSFKNTWSTGNEILSVCRTILKYHDVQIFYYDLAEVLCLITQVFDDVDVKDRAKIYYTMLTSLSKLKVQTIFNLHSSVKDAKSALNTFVAGGDSSQFACIQKLSKPVLKLIRMENKCEMHFEEATVANSFLSVCIPDILESYQNYLSKHEPTVTLTFVVRHVDGVDENLSNLYSIVINTHSEPPSKDIPVIEIPVLKILKASQHEGNMVNLYLKPVEPYPLTLHFKAEFTCERGYNYTCHLPSVALKFEDLFMPLPVPESIKFPAKLWRIKLFENLYDEFQARINSKETQSSYCQTILCLKNEKVFFSIMEQRWSPFIIDKKTNDRYSVALYLPHKNHILMKICIINDKPLINIVVDNNNTLPWITICLQDMSENI